MMAATERPARRARQQGVTLFGLLIWGVVIAMGAYVVLIVFPTVNEYWTIKRAVSKIAEDNPPTVAEVRAAFERQKDVEYSISSISEKDLEITKENEKVVIRFAYDKVLHLFGPVHLLIKYEGEGRSKAR